MSKWVWLAVGSLGGGFSRYLLAGLVSERTGPSFPYGTLMVNVTGCFLIGLFSALAEYKFVLGPQGRILLMTGFCGAYTTFSTFMLESLNLIKAGQLPAAGLNVAASLVLGGLAFLSGEFLVRLI